MKPLSIHAASPKRSSYLFHGIRIGVSYADPEIRSAIHSRLRHFAVGPAGPDEVSIEVDAIQASDDHSIFRPAGPGRAIYDSSVGEALYFDAEDLLYLDAGAHARVVAKPGEGLVRLSIVPHGSARAWQASHPLLTLPLIDVLKRRGLYSLHAAGLSLDGRGILFAGTSGAGKSTLTIALLRAGFGFLGDDFLFLTRANHGIDVLAFPDEIDVTEETGRFFPEVRARLRRPRPLGWPKWPIPPRALWDAPIVERCRPEVLIFPRVASKSSSTFQPIGDDEALLELVPNVLLTEERSSGAHLAALAALVAQCRCYRLETGRDLDRLPALIRQLAM